MTAVVGQELGEERFTKHTMRVRVSSLERLRDAVAGAQERGKRTTMEGAVSLGIKLAAKQIERVANDGQRFERRTADLPPGRRARRLRAIELPADDAEGPPAPLLRSVKEEPVQERYTAPERDAIACLKLGARVDRHVKDVPSTEDLRARAEAFAEVLRRQAQDFVAAQLDVELAREATP